MVLILIFITTILSGYVAGQTYTRNDIICTASSTPNTPATAGAITYTLTFDGTSKYSLTSAPGTATGDCSGCSAGTTKFATAGTPADGTQITRTVGASCKIDSIPLDVFFGGTFSSTTTASTVDVVCTSATDCQKYRYDRTGTSAITATSIGACTLNVCTGCTTVGQWGVSSTDAKLLTRTTNPPACIPPATVNIFDYFIITPTTTTTSTTSTTTTPSTTRKLSTNLIWSFGTITINLIGFLLINGLK